MREKTTLILTTHSSVHLHGISSLLTRFLIPIPMKATVSETPILNAITPKYTKSDNAEVIKATLSTLRTSPPTGLAILRKVVVLVEVVAEVLEVEVIVVVVFVVEVEDVDVLLVVDVEFEDVVEVVEVVVVELEADVEVVVVVVVVHGVIPMLTRIRNT